MADETLPKRRQTKTGPLQDQPLTTRMNTRKSPNPYNTRENLKINIIHLYGERVFHQTKNFEKLRTKMSKLKCDLTFLLRCRDENIIPKSMRLSFHKKNKRTQNILRKTSFALIRESIQDTRKALDNINKQLLSLHLYLGSIIHPTLWNIIDQLSNFRAETNTALTTEKQIKKFNDLYTQQNPTTIISTEEPTVVYNISSYQLDEALRSVLSKGFNYAISPSQIPVEEIISGVEVTISEMDKNIAEVIRQDVSQVLRTTRPPKKNLSYEESQALKKLKLNKNIIILPADKGNATVVMDTDDYDAKIRTLLQDSAYQPIATDPTTYLEKTTKNKIRESPINKEIQLSIIPREKSSRCPKLYGLPKIHKEGAPLRPIVSSIGSPVQHLAKYLAKQLQPYAEEANSYVKNASHFIELLREKVMEPGWLLVSFDIVSLFTNIPIDEALEIIEEKHHPPPHILSLTKHCLKNTYFIYEDQRYKQIEGAPMGSPLSPVIANLFMEHFEENALTTATNKPELWLRYVDDTFVIWPHGRKELDTFLEHLNNIHPRIKFTMEVEINNQLPFLDVLVKKKENGNLSHTVYRKATHTDRYLHAQSHHHPAQLQAVVKTLVTRSQRLADENNIQQEMEKLRIALHRNGFTDRNIQNALKPRRTRPQEEEKEEPLNRALLPYVKGTTDKISRILRRHNIKTTFKTNRKISTVLRNPKTKIPLEQQGVYEIPCADCDKVYIGQTNRRTNIRRDEHENAVRKNETTSSLAQHVKATSHRIDFKNTRVLANIEHTKSRIIREAIEIEKRPNNLNSRDDTQRLPTAWKPVIDKKRELRIITSNQPGKSPRPNEASHSQVIGPVTRDQTRPFTRSQARQQCSVKLVYKKPTTATNDER